MKMEKTAELVMAIKDYECEKIQKQEQSIDFAALDPVLDEKILLRCITEPNSKSGVVGIDAVRQMTETMESEGYDRGILISNSFSKAAKEEMQRKNIELISKKVTPSFKLQRIYLRIQDRIDYLCEKKCGKIPESELDCLGFSDGRYSCDIRLINDNASFHFENRWKKLLQNDLLRLLNYCVES